ncbi:Zn(2)-C6 fungal-type domain-containing protein [Trichoderma simmonsii]|uniref:Zn(2)-C6 fungal-type domain-containing protein n=1 Tax=Trichoderma simmonsii TaxID=1491479 RepID=A0A8G0LDY2_9HYPO|nr:Zn(2)-C6 fungal-type domain-containing protein [Trichoderma simmonsii]
MCSLHQTPADRAMLLSSCANGPTPARRVACGRSFAGHRPLETLTEVSSLTALSSSSSSSLPTSSSATSISAPFDLATGLVTMQTSVLSPIEAGQTTSSRQYPSLTRTGVSRLQQPFHANSSLVREGEDILQLLLEQYSHPDLEELVNNWYTDLGDSPVGGPLAKAAWRAIQSNLQNLHSSRLLNRLQATSRDIFEHTSRPLNMPTTAADGAIEKELCAIRWETVGIYFALIGMVIASAQSPSTSFSGRQWFGDRKATSSDAFDACMRCEALCNRVGQMNDLSVWLAVLATTLSTWCFGDDSCQAWRLMGNLSSTIFALNYHKGFRDDMNAPAYLIELRKRAMALSHELDKSLATFVGRPPRLNKSYCTIQLPLDLSDSVIVGPAELLALQISRLDGDGWNKDMEILTRASSTWETMPHFMQYEPSLWGRTAPSTIIMLLSLKLEYLYSKFLLYKMLVNQSSSHRHALIQISHETLGLVLSVMKKRDVIGSHRIDLEWTIVFYAMPCASVLILELFRLASLPKPQPSVALNRSTIIQDISVLISCCDWLTESGKGNYELCKQAQSIFSKALDQILNNEMPLTRPMPTSPTVSINDALSAKLPEVQNLDTITQDLQWAAWLDTVDFQGEPWLEMLKPPTNFFGDLDDYCY